MALLEGRLDPASFAMERVLDESMHRFMQRVRVVEEPELTAGYPAAFPTRVTVRTSAGERFVEEVTHYRGHALNPLNDSDLDVKFNAIVTETLGAARTSELLGVLRAIGDAPKVDHIARLLAVTEA